jgi:Domain of unknown function (DUF6894)
MARYFFNFINQKETILDEGVMVPEDVLEHSIQRIIEDIRSEEPELFDIGDGWSIEVIDEGGRRVATFPL